MIVRGLGPARLAGQHKPAAAAGAQRQGHTKRLCCSSASAAAARTQLTRWPLPPGTCRRLPNHNRTRLERGALQVTAALFEPPAFSPSKLSVEYLPGADALAPAPPAAPRRYTLTHNDVTGALRLSIGATFNARQVRGFYTRVLRDEVVAEWRWGGAAGAGGDVGANADDGLGMRSAPDGGTTGGSSSSSGGGGSSFSNGSTRGRGAADTFGSSSNGNGSTSGSGSAINPSTSGIDERREAWRLGADGAPYSQQQQQQQQHQRPSLHVFCHVSGEERWLAPPALRNFVFRREMGLVLDTLAFADRALLAARPDLRAADVLVHFQSRAAPALDVVEHWGTLGDRRSWQRLPRGLGARLALLLRGFPPSARRLERTPCGARLVLRARDGSERVWAAAGPPKLNSGGAAAGGGGYGDGGVALAVSNSISASISSSSGGGGGGGGDGSSRFDEDQAAAVVVNGSSAWDSSSTGNGGSSNGSNGNGRQLARAPALAPAAVVVPSAAAPARTTAVAVAAAPAASVSAAELAAAPGSGGGGAGERAAAQPLADRATAAGAPR